MRKYNYGLQQQRGPSQLAPILGYPLYEQKALHSPSKLGHDGLSTQNLCRGVGLVAPPTINRIL
jgi:hypothetical protein